MMPTDNQIPIEAEWNYRDAVTILKDLIFLANEKEYAGVVSLAEGALYRLKNIGAICGINGDSIKDSQCQNKEKA